MPKRIHQLMLGAIALVLTLGVGNDSPPSVIEHMQRAEMELLRYEKEVMKIPQHLGKNGELILTQANKMLLPLKNEIERESNRIVKIQSATGYSEEEIILTEATLRYVNLMGRVYYLYAKAAQSKFNPDPRAMSFSKLVGLDLRLHERFARGLLYVGTYLTPRHDPVNPYYWFITLPHSDRMLAELFSLSRNDDLDMMLSKNYSEEKQLESELVLKYRDTVFRINTEREYARLLQFMALRETLFNRWVINRLRSDKIPETPVHGCANDHFLSFKTRSSSTENPSQMEAYTAWAEQEERIFDLEHVTPEIYKAVKQTQFATHDQHFNVFLKTMKYMSGYDVVLKSRLPLALETSVNIEEKLRTWVDPANGNTRTFGQRVSDYIQDYWEQEGADVIMMSNHPSDPLRPQDMAKRLAILAYDKFREAAAGQIATDLLQEQWVVYEKNNEADYDSKYNSLVEYAATQYDALYKESFIINVAARVQVIYEKLQNPVIKNQINKEILDKKIEILTEYVKPILPWIKEYRELRMSAIRRGIIKQYDFIGAPIPTEFEHQLLNRNSKVPRIGTVDSFGAVLMALQSRFSLAPYQKTTSILQNSPDVQELLSFWIQSATDSYSETVKANGLVDANDQSKGYVVNRGDIALAFKTATEKLRERVKPKIKDQAKNWIKGVVQSTTVISEENKQAIIDWLKSPAAKVSEQKPASQTHSHSNAKDVYLKDIPVAVQQQVFKPIKESGIEGVNNSNKVSSQTHKPVATHEEMEIELQKAAEKLIDAMGLSGELPIHDEDLLKTDFDRMQYAMSLMGQAIAVHPMFGIPIYDADLSSLMHEENNYQGDGWLPHGSGGKEGLTTITRNGDHKSTITPSAPPPRFSRMIEILSTYYKHTVIEKVAPEKGRDIYSEFDIDQAAVLIKKSIDTAATNGTGLFETFCKADFNQWNKDANFKKIFLSTATVRKAMMDLDQNIRELDKEMQSELRSPMQKFQEDWLEPIMNGLFYVSLIFLVVMLPISPLAAVMTALIRVYVPKVIVVLIGGMITYGFNTTMIANMVTRTYVNFHEKPIDVKFAEAVAMQNFGDSDKALTSWSESMSQKNQLKAEQRATVVSNLLDGAFAGMFVSQMKFVTGHQGKKIAERWGFKLLNRDERLAQSLTTREEVKAIQNASESTGGKRPTRLQRAYNEGARLVQRSKRALFPKYQTLSEAEILAKYDEQLIMSVEKNAGEDLAVFAAEEEAMLAWNKARRETKDLTFREILSNPLLSRFWAAPRVYVNNFVDALQTKNWKSLLELNKGLKQLREDIELARHAYLIESDRVILASRQKRLHAMQNPKTAASTWIKSMDLKEKLMRAELGKGPGGFFARFFKGDFGPNYFTFNHPTQELGIMAGSFVDVAWVQPKSWWGDNVEQLRYTKSGKELHEIEKKVTGKWRQPDPMRDTDFVHIQSMKQTQKILVDKGIIDPHTGKIIKSVAEIEKASSWRPLEVWIQEEKLLKEKLVKAHIMDRQGRMLQRRSDLGAEDAELLDAWEASVDQLFCPDVKLVRRYLRSDQMKVTMSLYGADFKDPKQVAIVQDFIEMYGQMQLIDGSKILTDKAEQKAIEALDKKLGFLGASTEDLINRYNQR